MPLVHVDALWHHRVHRLTAHQWLRQTLVGIGASAFDA
jgi:hypothetical protein